LYIPISLSLNPDALNSFKEINALESILVSRYLLVLSLSILSMNSLVLFQTGCKDKYFF